MEILMKLILLIISITCLNSRKISETIETIERNEISTFRYWHNQIQYDQNLIQIAKKEAERLATSGILTKPNFTNVLNSNYAGQSKQIDSVDFDAANSSNFVFLLIQPENQSSYKNNILK